MDPIEVAAKATRLAETPLSRLGMVKWECRISEDCACQGWIFGGQCVDVEVEMCREYCSCYEVNVLLFRWLARSVTKN